MPVPRELRDRICLLVFKLPKMSCLGEEVAKKRDIAKHVRATPTLWRGAQEAHSRCLLSEEAANAGFVKYNKSHPSRQSHTYPLEKNSGSPFDLALVLASKTIYMEAYHFFGVSRQALVNSPWNTSPRPSAMRGYDVEH